MRDIKNILTATDFSRGAEIAARAAKYAAELHQAKLIAVHVLQNMDETVSFLVEDLGEAQKKAELEAEQNMGELLADLRLSRSTTRSVVTEGSPIDGLIRVGLREHADLIVAGMLGEDRNKSTGTLGSVVEQLVMCGLFDLLLVHEDHSQDIKGIAVATDFSEYADIALRRAVDLAERAGIDTVWVIHAYEWPRGYSKLGLTPEETDVKCRENARAAYEELGERVPAPAGITYQPLFVRGRPEEAVRDACEQHEIDMLVIGAAGRTAAAVALIGNVAIKIVRQTPCTVWITRPAGRQLTFIDGIRRLMGLDDD